MKKDGLERVIMKVESEQIGSCVGHTAIVEAVRLWILQNIKETAWSKDKDRIAWLMKSDLCKKLEIPYEDA